MFNDCKGFTLGETVSSLIIWLTVVTFLLPNLIFVIQDRRNLQLEQRVRHALIHEIELRRTGGLESGNHLPSGFELIDRSRDGYMELCIEYEDLRKFSRERCLIYSEDE